MNTTDPNQIADNLKEMLPNEPKATHSNFDSSSSPTPDEEHPPFRVHDRRFWAKTSESSANDAEAEAPPPTPLQKLETEKALLQERLNATLLQYKEAKDEFEQAKVRVRRDIQKEIDAGKKAILADLLEVMDNLERALEAPQTAEDSAMRRGVQMVYEQFVSKLRNLGVEKVEALHRPFDPARFDAISTITVTDPAQDNMVLGVIKPCYLLGDEVLRIGSVAVGKKDT